MYTKILVPHAGTKAGNIALIHTQKLAKKLNAHVTILHVVEPIPIPPSISLSPERRKLGIELEKARRELKIEMHKKMESLAVELRKQNIPTRIKVTHGYPDEEITRAVKEENHDFLIMAKRRKLPGIKGVLKLGSTSRKVLEKVSCPVLLIDGEK